MGKLSQWESQIDGSNYSFSYEKVKGKHILTVNGTPMEIKSSFLSMFFGFDEAFMLDGREARLVVIKNTPDIVINETCVQSGKPHRKRPAWVIVFAVLCGLLVILGGGLGALIGICGAAACIGVSRASLSTIARVLLCTLITIFTWFVWYILVIIITLFLF